MRLKGPVRRVTVFLCLTFLSALSPAWAGVISDTPTLPLLGIPFASATGAGCFPAVNVCIGSGSLTLTSLVSSTFNKDGQDVVAKATLTGQLTSTGGTPMGPITLTGTLEMEILGRTTSKKLGTWTTEIESLALSGPVLDHTLTVTLDPAHVSKGVSSIQEIAGEDCDPEYLINSSFDVFVALNLDTVPPLSTTRGPLHFDPTPAPEPASLLLLAPALLGLSLLRRRQRLPVTGEEHPSPAA